MAAGEHGAERRLVRSRERLEADMNQLVSEVRAGESLGASVESEVESEASPYRQAEELARELYGRR